MKTSVQIFTVTAEEAGQKLLQYLARRLGGLPQAALQRFVRTGQVRLDGRRCKPFDRIALGQRVRVPPYEMADTPGTPPAPAPARPRPERRQEPALDILPQGALNMCRDKGHHRTAAASGVAALVRSFESCACGGSPLGE